MDLRRGLANALDQLANGAEELVEPAGQLRGFILTAHDQAGGQVALALGNVFKAIGYGTNGAHDEAGEEGTDEGEGHCTDYGNQPDHPGQPVGAGHHVALADQANELPTQLFRGIHVSHVALAAKLHFHQTLLRRCQLCITVTQFR